jgi:hypothetical protein
MEEIVLEVAKGGAALMHGVFKTFFVMPTRQKSLQQHRGDTYLTMLEYGGYSHDGVLANIRMPVI